MFKRESRGDKLFYQALLHFNKREWSESVDLAQQALKKKVKSYDLAHVYAVLGFSLGKLSRMEEAIAAHKKSIEINPKHVMAWRDYGITLRVKGDYDGAENCYENALSIDPNDEKTIASLGALYVYRDKPQKAIEIIHPTLQDGVVTGATFGNYAHALAMVGRFDDADLYLAKAIAQNFYQWRDIQKTIMELREYHSSLNIKDTSWLPEQCSQCGAAMSDETVHWINKNTVQCGYCGSVNRKK